MKFSKRKTFAIQCAVFAGLLLLLELGALGWERWLKPPPTSVALIPMPYVMSRTQQHQSFTWDNLLTHEQVPSTIKLNNYGYSETIDYMMIPDEAYLRKHGKQPGEILVLLTGASTVHSVGATANDKTISAQMMHYLNGRSTGPRYRVLNMAMGSWNAYQEFIGLSLFGAPLKPDWVVMMDGTNDGAVTCPLSTGAGNPMDWPRMLYLMQGGQNPEGVSPAIETLGRYSALVRAIFGLEKGARKKLSPTLVFDDQDKKHPIKMTGVTVDVLDTQLNFYLQAERNIMDLFHKSNILISTAPMMYDNAVTTYYRKAFNPESASAENAARTKAELDDYMNKHRGKPCGIEYASESNGYFMARVALALTDEIARTQAEDKSRTLLYVNAEAAMPFEVDQRMPFYIDNGHMSDRGQERMGEFFADVILSAEARKQFDYREFIKRHQPSTVSER